MKDKKVLNFWYWAGRVLPLAALALLMIELVFDLDSFLEYTMCAIAISFGVFAFTWWWWVLDTVRGLYGMLNTAQEKFSEVINELREIKEQVNDSNRKRSKSSKNKS